jgi:hypothetical protein
MEVNMRGKSIQSGGLCGRIEISYAIINLHSCIEGIYLFHICVSVLHRLRSWQNSKQGMNINLPIFILYWLQEALLMHFLKELVSTFIVRKYVAENLSSDVSASSEG